MWIKSLFLPQSYVDKMAGKNGDSLVSDNLGNSVHDASAAETFVASLHKKTFVKQAIER
jgi:hypothetical protein